MDLMGTTVSVTQSPSNQLEIVENVPTMPGLPARYVRFGNFQIDVARQELFKDGERVRMQAKVYQALVLLVSGAGNVVTREEVGRRLWPERLPMALDANVNTAMNKLRQGLGDSKENPVYIETIPRRGYCFIAPLEFSDLAAPAAPGKTAAQTAETTYPEAHSQQIGHTLPVARVVSLLLAGMVLGALLTLAWSSFYNRSHKPLSSAQDVTSHPAASSRR
jgi:DNA-binding winged helix-turn-helix (wHTH) protein